MARKSRHSILKRQRELRKQEKAEAKRLKKLARAEAEAAGDEIEGETDGEVEVELAEAGEGDAPESTGEPVVTPLEGPPQPTRQDEI